MQISFLLGNGGMLVNILWNLELNCYKKIRKK